MNSTFSTMLERRRTSPRSPSRSERAPLLASAFLLVFAVGPLQAADLPDSAQRTLSDLDRLKGAVVDVLKTRTREIKASDRETVVRAITLAGELHIVEAAELLVEWVSLPTTSAEDFLVRARTLDERYPAYAALHRLGADAIPAIVAKLRTTDPILLQKIGEAETGGEALLKKHREQDRVRLLVSCLAEVLGTGGHGIELTKLHLKLDITKATGKERDALLAVYEWRFGSKP